MNSRRVSLHPHKSDIKGGRTANHDSCAMLARISNRSRVAQLVTLLLSSVEPDRCVGTLRRMSGFLELELFETVLPSSRVSHAARARDRFDLPAFDKGRPKRDGNERRAHQR